MFTSQIVDSDAFQDMPLSAQALYFHLGMKADDDGFLGNPKRVQKMIGASEDDMKLLQMKRFVYLFDTGICVIKHWKMHNYIPKDRYKPTVYEHEKSLLEFKQNKSYTAINGSCIHDGYTLYTDCIPRLGKDRLGKSSKDILSDSIESDDACLQEENSRIPFKDIIDYLNELAETQYRYKSKATQAKIKARYNEGFTIDDFKTVISKKSAEWKNTEMAKYLRPETLFSPKFEGYLNQKVVNQETKVLPSWWNNQDNVVSYDDFDEGKLEEKLRKLRGVTK